MNHRIGRLLFGFGVGLLVALFAYRWVADDNGTAARAEQEQAVLASRQLLESMLAIGELELVDPLLPDRVVGKAYVYPAGDGWQVSGFYRRDASDLWHPYLVTLDASLQLLHLKISDTALLGRNGNQDGLEVLP